MTDLTGPLVLPPSLRRVPVADLAPETRERLGGEPGDVALTDPGSRTPSRLVSAETAVLLERFREPATLAQAVLAFGRERGLDPERVLEEAYPLFRRLAEDGFLVPAGGPEARGSGATLRRGDRFAGFEVVTLCQATEDSEVVQARGPDGFVALKVEKVRGSSGPAQSLDFEAAVLGRLDGEVAPRLLARGVEEGGGTGRRWLALEWLPGADAGTAARELRALPPLFGPGSRGGRPALHRLGLSLLRAYARLHERGVLHGDVHPGNVLVAPDGSLRLVDFGAAALSAPGEVPGRSPRGGVAYYYEPECAASMLGRGVPLPPSPAGEQYSVAALLYSLLAGVHYRDFPLTREGLLGEIVSGAPRRFEEAGLDPWPEAELILARALAKAPEARYPSVAGLALAWEGIAPGPGGAAPASSAALRRSALAPLVERALARLAPGGEAFALEAPPAPAASVMFGAAGASLALLHMAKAREDGDLLSLADHWLAKAGRRAALPGAWESAERGLPADLVEEGSPFHGAAGLDLAAAHLARALGEPELEAAATGRFLRRAGRFGRGGWKSSDLTLGAAGALLAASDLLPGSPPSVRPELERVGRELLDLVRSGGQGGGPVEAGDGLRALGMAHGWAGRLYAALRWCRASGERLPPECEERLFELAALAEPWGRGLRWPRLAADGTDLGSLAGWCKGSAGFYFLWDEALRRFPEGVENPFARLREGAAWNAWEGRDEGADLCCGIAGRSYALLSLFRRTGEVAWRERAHALAERAARAASRPERGGDAADALFKGALGVAVLGVDLEAPESAAFPFFEEAR